ncbi:MAG: thioredoxin-dependent thiol peroxidase [Bacilli bacterium]
MLEVGSKAIDFTLKNQFNEDISLSMFKGKKIVLYFYPKDNTPGCTTQACSFRDNFERFKDNDIVVIGVSVDDVNSHKKFIEKFDLPFHLLADTEKKVVNDYQVWVEKSMYGKKYMGTQRSTFIIDEFGVIEKVFEKAKPDTNASEILEYLNK